MGKKTKIEWTDATWNPLRGCSRVSAGCMNCYAEAVANRFKGPGQPYEGLIAKGGQWNGSIKLIPEILQAPLRWKKPRSVFVNSMSDLFHENVPFEFIAAVFAIMSVTTRHTYQVLTKRPARMLEFFDWAREENEPLPQAEGDTIAEYWPEEIPWEGYDNCGPSFPYENIWLGVSIEDQATADERIPLLLRTPAAVRWVSAEPLLGPVEINFIGCPECGHSKNYWAPNFTICRNCGNEVASPPENTIDWVVVGGESGKNARPMQLDWVRSLRDQCLDTGTPFFFKQWGEFAPNFFTDEDGEYAGGPIWMDRIGKKSAGRLLDGREWNEYPEGE